MEEVLYDVIDWDGMDRCLEYKTAEKAFDWAQDEFESYCKRLGQAHNSDGIEIVKYTYGWNGERIIHSKEKVTVYYDASIKSDYDEHNTMHRAAQGV